MGLFQRGEIWWYEFWFAGQRVRESTKSPSKTVAKEAEKRRKRELEEGFNNVTDQRRDRVRTFRDMADDFYTGYQVRLPDSATFAEYAIEHLKRLLGAKMAVDFNEAFLGRSRRNATYIAVDWGDITSRHQILSCHEFKPGLRVEVS